MERSLTAKPQLSVETATTGEDDCHEPAPKHNENHTSDEHHPPVAQVAAPGRTNATTGTGSASSLKTSQQMDAIEQVLYSETS